jgi:uncharacterized membrane-anchored protein YitT (DUF2179 family)
MVDFKDDSRVPEEIKFSYSVGKLMFAVIISFALIAFSIYTFVEHNGIYSKLFSVVILIIAALNIHQTNKKLKYFRPVLILSDKGIETKGEFLPWNDIANEMINYKNEAALLEYDHVWDDKIIETIKIGIAELKDADADYIKHILKIYRGRYENNN